MYIINLMRKSGIFIFLLSLVLSLFFFTRLSFSQDLPNLPIAEYLCELGINYYDSGRYEEALLEFKKALIVNPDYQLAKEYIGRIFGQDMAREQQPAQVQLQAQLQAQPQTQQQKSKAEDVKKQLQQYQEYIQGLQEESERETISAVPSLNISGEGQLSIGITGQDCIWKQANGDLNERNWRMLSWNGYNRRENTYDTRVYDRLRFNLDSTKEEGFGFHTNITVDPWSFTGKSDKITVTGSGGDTAEIELKYWSNNRYTINDTVYTLQNGDSFALPELKVVNGRVLPTTITSVFSNTFSIPQTEIEREYQSLLRELWFDYKQRGLKLRFFPIAYQDQALTSDDPLRLSNNHIWWEESPWLDKWKRGNFNSGASPNDFTKGEWDDALSFFTRDSDGTRLTALRGFSLSFEPSEGSSLDATIASPKGLWQDYDSFDNFASALRFKHLFAPDLRVGNTYTFRLGLNEDNNKKDITNHVMAVDLDYEPVNGLKLSAEYAQSFTRQDLTSPGYASKSRGSAYYFSLTGSSDARKIMDLEYGYNEIKPRQGQDFFAKARLYLVHMDESFAPSLSTYRETRDDMFWSRHITFRRPFEHYFTGLYYPSTKWEDIEPYRIGNGIDIGRDVIGLRIENSHWDRKLENLFDLRNVHYTNGKYIETVSRDEITYKPTDKLTVKLLGIYQDLPKTKGGIDPFIFDADSGDYLANTAIPDAADPTLKTGSLGLEYKLFDWLAINGIWERTNDYTLAYDNYPRGNLNSSTFSTFTEYGKVYRKEDTYLYSQDLFPLPPYPFYNIFKAGLSLEPIENMHIYLDYTRNEFKSAGQVDDNMNHVGFEMNYSPIKKLEFYFKYTYSRWNDLNQMTLGQSDYYFSHHNFFTEIRYRLSEDEEFTFQYGEGGRSPIATVTYDPFGAGLLTLDTRHIVRMYYRRKF
jgi:hypothetical protein